MEMTTTQLTVHCMVFVANAYLALRHNRNLFNIIANLPVAAALAAQMAIVY